MTERPPASGSISDGKRAAAPGRDLPSGTVTFLFTDIQGSTDLARRLRDGWPAVLQRHRQILRAAFGAHAGRELGTEGDSFFVVFPDATGAVAAAVEAQRGLAEADWPAEGRVAVRMGLHTAEAYPEDGAYVGIEVHRAARVSAAGHGGQVLLSSTTATLVDGHLPAHVELRRLGNHRLKDLPEPEEIHQLIIEGLASDFPPLRAQGPRRADLPRQLTSFVGRNAEVAAVEASVDDARLVTLTGPGGTGKTRLALRVATDLVERFDDGASFVPLAPVADPTHVPAAIAQVLDITDAGDQPLEVTLEQWLRERELLLVLDNFEHLLAAAPLVSRLLAAADRLHVLATSRELLRLGGEREYPVPPLAVPSGSDAADAERLLESDAVALFVDRARSALPGFSLTDENAAAVLAICRRLDGLPLALELAAARLRILSPQALLDRLDRSLETLATGARDAPERQQTLRGAIAWSEQLLDEPERRLFRRLAVFRGGWTFEAAEAVAGAIGDLGVDVLDGLSSLADKSLIRPVAAAAEPRSLMLQTIREYALERLAAEGERTAAERAHAGYFSALAAAAREHVEGGEAASWMDRLDRESGNLRAALEWLIEHDAAGARRMGPALWRYWQRRGHLGEGRRWLERIEALPDGAATPGAQAGVHAALGSIAYWQNDFATSRAAYEKSLAIWREIGEEGGLQDATYNLGFIHLVEHRFDDARDAFGESLVLAERLGNQQAIGRLQFGLAMTALVEGKLQEARERYEETIRILEPLGEEYFTWTARRNLVEAATRAGELDEAEARNREIVRHAYEVRDLPMLAMALDDFASIESIRGDGARAIRLGGAAAGVKERAGGGAPVPLITVVDVREAAVGSLDDAAITRLWEEGRRLDDEGAYALAVGELEASPD
jgi:predicted ATPase/class 3 adenylate cyclase